MKFEQKGTIKGTEMLTFGDLSRGNLFIPINEDGEVYIRDDEWGCTRLSDGVLYRDDLKFKGEHPVIRVTGTLTYKKDPNQDPKGEHNED